MSLSILQEAAKQVQFEDSLNGSDALLFAADQIAQERGLTSPYKNGKNLTPISNFSPRGEFPQNDNNHESGLDIDAIELLKEMKIDINLLAVGDISNDVEALLNMQTKKVKQNEQNQKGAGSRKKYLRKYQVFLANQIRRQNFIALKGRHSDIYAVPSKVSKLIDESIENEWGYDLLDSRIKNSAQEHLLRNMMHMNTRPKSSLNERNAEPKKDEEKYSKLRQSVDRLSQPHGSSPSKVHLKVDPSLLHTTLDDAKECSFHPVINKYPKDKNKNSAFSFIARQEAEERNRRDELDYKIGKADYDAKVDKKICAQCGAKQSYDEIKEKRKKCPNCQVEYLHKLQWGKVARDFYQRELNFTQRVQDKNEFRQKELDDNDIIIHKKVLDKRTGQIKIVDKKIRQNKITIEEEEEFFNRLNQRLAEREAKLKHVESTMYHQATFQPTVSSTSSKIFQKRNELHDFQDDGTTSYMIEQFLNRVDEDLDYRCEKFPQKYIPIHKIHEKKKDEQPFKI